MYSSFGRFEFMFTVVPLFIFVIFIAVIILFILSIIKGVAGWNKNNEAPLLSVDAKVTAKRTNVSSRRSVHNDDDFHSHLSTYTDYFVTFEVESGDRMEFSVTGADYGMIADGDRGKLVFQGTRFKGFERATGQ